MGMLYYYYLPVPSNNYCMNKKILSFFLACSIFSDNLFAGGSKVGLQGIKQIGMAHTGVGFAQDASTIYFNPAGMSFVINQFVGGMNALIPSTSFLEKGTNITTDATAQVFTPLAAYGQLKLSKRINVGIGAYTPFGSGVMYPAEWTGRYTLTEVSLQTIFIQPTVSFRITDKLSIGGGYIFANGRVNLEKDLPIASSTNSNDAHARLNGDAKGNGYNVGIYYKNDKRFNFGVTYHSEVTMNVDEGTADFTNIPTALSTTFPAKNTFVTELDLPAELAVGTSFKLNKRTTFAADFNYTYWKTFDSLGFDYGLNTSSVTDAKSPRLYENAMAFRAGIQYDASRNTQLRVGAFFDQTPIQNGYVSPELPDNDRLGLTAGASFKLEDRLQLDLSIMYQNVFKRTQTNKETGLSGTFHTKVLAPGAGLTWQIRKRTSYAKNY